VKVKKMDVMYSTYHLCYSYTSSVDWIHARICDTYRLLLIW
jgi:hypothetical protein